MLNPIPDLKTNPSVRGLIYVLRHRELWPEKFVWEYTNCVTCAMGLCLILCGIDPVKAMMQAGNNSVMLARKVCRLLRIPKHKREIAIAVLCNGYVGHSKPMFAIEPEDVADGLEFFVQ